MEDLVKLSALLVLPPSLSFATLLFFSRKQKQPIAESFKLHPEYGLAKQGPFIFWTSIPIFYFLVSGVLSWHGHTIDISAQGFGVFFEISKLPLMLLAFSLPIAALISRLHGTRQSAEQINLTRKKNNLDIFYSHRKALIDYFDYNGEAEYEGKLKAKFKAHPRLHIKFFMSAHPEQGIPDLNKKQFNDLINLLSATRASIQFALSTSIMFGENHKKLFEEYASACNGIYKIAELLVIPEIYKSLKEDSKKLFIVTDAGKINFTTIGTTRDDIIGAYRYCRSFSRLLCEFSGFPVDYFIDKNNPIDDGIAYQDLETKYHVTTLISLIENHMRHSKPLTN